MAYIAASTKTTGTLITAATWNQDIVANSAALYAGAMALTSQAQYDLVQASSATQLARIAGAALGILGTDSSKVPAIKTATAGQSWRANAAGTDVEAYTPSDPSIITVTAGETLVAGDVVMIATQVGYTKGRAYKMIANGLSPLGPYICTVGGNAGASVTVQIGGVVPGLTSLTVGPYYVSAASAGAMVTTPPAQVIPIGVALSTTTLLLDTRGVWAVLATGLYGYALGGMTSSEVATTDRLTWSSGVTAANTASNLSTVRKELVGIGDMATYGYVCGGSSATYVTTQDRTAFSTSVTAANTATALSTARIGSAGCSDGALYGYVIAGHAVAISATTDRLTFSTSALAAHTAANSTTVRYFLAGVSDVGTGYGYACGGSTSGGGTGDQTVIVDRLTFSTSTTAARTAANLTVARQSLAGVSDGGTYGYLCGGHSNAAEIATTDRLVFSTSTTAANTASNLSGNRRDMAGTSDGQTYGYVLGGNMYATADRITFSTSVTAASTPANLSSARYRLAAFSDACV